MIIGFCGYAQSGKDTAALPLIQRGFLRIAFADALKRRAAKALGITEDYLEHRKHELRPLLVELGRAGRLVDREMWIEAAFDDVVAPDIVITDVRYPNEVAEILSRDGRVFFVDRPGKGPANEEEAASINDVMHRYQLPVIHNDGTVERLHREVERMI